MTPQFVDAYKALDGKKDRKVEVILMNYDSDQKGMDKYMLKSKINFPGLKNKETKGNFLSKIYPAEALPSAVIADANGKVIASGVGGAEIAKKVIAKMKQLAK